MPRKSRVVFPGYPHHVTQRGARRLEVFFEPSDRDLYLKLLSEVSAKLRVSVLAYCLMTNHVHLVVVPQDEKGLHLLFKSIHSSYARHVNHREKWSGHLWQSRFFSSPLDPEYLRNTVRYVELNPFRAGMVQTPSEYLWSSVHDRLENCSRIVDLKSEWNGYLPDAADWLNFLEEGSDAADDIIRRNLSQNLPCGNDLFVKNLETLSGRPLRFRSQGRPRKR